MRGLEGDGAWEWAVEWSILCICTDLWRINKNIDFFKGSEMLFFKYQVSYYYVTRMFIFLSCYILHLRRWDRKGQNLFPKPHGLESPARKIMVFKRCLLHWEEQWSRWPQGFPLLECSWTLPADIGHENVHEFLSNPGTCISTMREDHPRLPMSALLVKAACQYCRCPWEPYGWWHALLTCGDPLLWHRELWGSSHSCSEGKDSNLLCFSTLSLWGRFAW